MLNSTLLIWISAALFMVVYTYFVVTLFLRSHIEIELPGRLFPIHLERQGELKDDGALLPPEEESEAFTVRLPSLLLQLLFYRKAVLRLTTDSKNFRIQWEKTSFHKDEEDTSTLKLPVKQKNGAVTAYWMDVSARRTMVTLNFKQGKTTSSILLLPYPEGIVDKKFK